MDWNNKHIHTFKLFCALFLTATMIMGILPLSALAENETENISQYEECELETELVLVAEDVDGAVSDEETTFSNNEGPESDTKTQEDNGETNGEETLEELNCERSAEENIVEDEQQHIKKALEEYLAVYAQTLYAGVQVYNSSYAYEGSRKGSLNSTGSVVLVDEIDSRVEPEMAHIFFASENVEYSGWVFFDALNDELLNIDAVIEGGLSKGECLHWSYDNSYVLLECPYENVEITHTSNDADILTENGEESFLGNVSESNLMMMALGTTSDVRTAQELFDSFAAAEEGGTITLGADVTYDQSTLGTIYVDKAITLDCGDYKISVDDALFQIETTGSLTLVNAQIESDGDIITNVYGGLTITSTSGSGLVAGGDIIDYAENATILVENGTFASSGPFVDETDTATITIENGSFTSNDYCFDDMCNTTVLFKNGTVIAKWDCFYVSSDTGKNSKITIMNGSFVSTEEGIVDNNADPSGSASLTIYNGTFSSKYDVIENDGEVTVHDGNFTSHEGEIIDNEGAVTVYGGTFTTHGDEVIDNYCEVTIYGGTFLAKNDLSAECNVIYTASDEGTCKVTLYGGTFSTGDGTEAFYVEDGGLIVIADGYYGEPEDWKETGADSIAVKPLIFEITFLDLEDNEIYKETVSSGSSVMNWPDTPASPGDEYRWWGWTDSEGMRYSDGDTFMKAVTLQAKYVKEGLPDEPDDPEEPDDPDTPTTPDTPEKPSAAAVTVTSYDELKSAIENGETNIVISGTVTYPARGTLTINADTYITGINGAEITGPGNFFNVSSSTVLTLDNLKATTDTNRVVYMYYGSTLNVVSGYYSAPDDVIYGGTVNLYGGTLTEMTGSDGPIYNATVVYKNHTKDSNDSVSIIEVTPKPPVVLILYKDAVVFRTETLYAGDTMILPEDMGDGFIGWFDASGKQYVSSPISEELTLYAKYKTEMVRVTFVDGITETTSEAANGTELSSFDSYDAAKVWKDDEGTVWNSDSKVITDIVLYAEDDFDVVITYDELLAALAGTKDTIVIGAEIPMKDTVTVNRTVTISAVNGGSLVRTSENTVYLLSIVTEADIPTLVELGNVVIDGKDIEATTAAVSVDNGSSLILRGTIIRNNNNSSEDRAEAGGAIYTEGKVSVYSGTTLCSNKAYLGGGVFVSCRDDTGCLYLYGGDICHNTAWSTSSCDGAGGGVHIDSAGTWNYVGLYMYGGHIHHNSAQDKGDNWRGSSGGGVSLTCGDDGIHFIMYGGEITDNSATDEGGAVYLGCSSMAMHGGVMARNVAATYGGAVSSDCCDNVLYMYGGVITLNTAAEGGGVYADGPSQASYELYGNVYGNLATKSGDDIAAGSSENSYNNTLTIVRSVNDPVTINNPYGTYDSSLGRPDYRIYTLVDGYDFNSDSKLKFLGWFDDNADDGYGSGGYPIHRYVVGDSQITTDTSKASFVLKAGEDVKAVYAGYFLVYDANNETGDYQYDSNTYWNEKAVTADCMFERTGYRFIGWNSKADASGNWYYPDFNGYNKILMDSNHVVYAQWEKLLTVEYVVEGDEVYRTPDDGKAPTDENSPYIRNSEVIVKENLTTAWTTSDGTADGIPGTWTFKPWDKENFKITEDTTITGSWTFTPDTYKVTYVVNGDGTYGIPTNGKAPEDENNPYDYNADVIVKAGLTTTWTTSDGTADGIPGTWTFKPWDKENFKITEDTTITGSWTFTPGTTPVPEVGNLTVSKTISGNAADSTKAFDFTVTLSDSSISGTYGGMSFSAGVATFALKGGESITAEGLPDGVRYVVSEADYSAESYVTTKSGDTGTIAANDTHTAAFTNTKDEVVPVVRTGNLMISKTVTGDLGDRTKYFSFTVTFDAEGSFSYTGSKSGTISNGGTIQLKHGESVTIYDLPAGTQYSVTESGNTGYRVYVSGDTGVIIENGTANAQFTNTKSKVPITGDNSNLAIWIIIMSISVTGMIITVIYRHKKDKKTITYKCE